jgi:hypothetical protein
MGGVGLARWASRDSIDLLNAWTIACATLVCIALLYAVGQPLFTDDAWWHLALGAAYLGQGPWLDSDPLLFTAVAPPPPASWLADALLFGVWQALGFAGLRATHVAIVAITLLLAGWAIRRASGSYAAAALGTALFAVLAAYRLVQLRPDLLSIAGAIVIYLLVLEKQEPPSWSRVAAAAGGMALWSNLHPAFPLGLVLLGAGLAASLVGWALAPSSQRGRPATRAFRLGAACGLATFASAANPMGLSAHLLALRAGTAPSTLAHVVDEWRETDLFALPLANLPPSPLSWALVWVLLVATLGLGTLLAARLLRGGRAGEPPSPPDLVPLALAATSLVAMVMASRFLWLGLFPILLIARSVPHVGPSRVSRRRLAAALALATLGAALSFPRLGAWPMITRALPVSLEGYRLPYRALKYQADVAWLMADAGLEGQLVAPYSAAGFLGFWLSPKIRTVVNGSLNVPAETMPSALAVQSGLGTPEQPDLEALLDELGADLFLGAGVPVPGRANRPADYTTTLLEASPGWLPIFRTPDASLFMRRNARNADNLRRITDYYARAGVPFDPVLGFEPGRALREAAPWAIEQRLVPAELLDLAIDPEGEAALPAELLDATTILLLLGEYEGASRLNDRLIETRPGHPVGHRRRIWLALVDDHAERSLREQKLRQSAARLARRTPADPIAGTLVQAAGHFLSGGALPRMNLMRLPVMDRAEVRRVLRRLGPPKLRTLRSTDASPNSDQSASNSSRKSKMKRSSACFARASLPAASIEEASRTTTRGVSRAKGPRSSASRDRSESISVPWLRATQV